MRRNHVVVTIDEGKNTRLSWFVDLMAFELFNYTVSDWIYASKNFREVKKWLEEL